MATRTPRARNCSTPPADTFTKLTGPGRSLTEEREFAVAATLRSGQVLIAGGGDLGGAVERGTVNPATDTFTKLAGAALTEARRGAVASMPPVKVLIAGGAAGGSETLSSAELFDPTTDRLLKARGNGVTEGREHAVAARLPSGEVLIAGGSTGIKGPHFHSQEIVSSAELFDPATDTFTKLTGHEQSLTEARKARSLRHCPNGEVLIAGGEGSQHFLER